MSYVENLIHVFEIETPQIGVTSAPLRDGFFFAVRKAVDLKALRQAVIAKLSDGLAQHVILAGNLNGVLDQQVNALVASANYDRQECRQLAGALINPIVLLANDSLCLLTARFCWRGEWLSDQQALGVLGLLRENAALRKAQPAALLSGRASADAGLGHAIGQRSTPFGLIVNGAR